MSFFQSLWHIALDFVYPPHCLLCQSPLDDGLSGLCRACEGRILARDSGTEPIEIEAHVPLFILSDFHDDVRRLTHLLKYSGKTQAGAWLGTALGHRLSGQLRPAGAWTAVPVPLHAARKRDRGYNQSVLIARAAGRVLGMPVWERGLKRLRNTPTQTHLDIQGRKENVAGAFGVRHPNRFKGRKVLLFDDVVTTGATVRACIGVLRDCGVDGVAVAAVARPHLGHDRTTG